MDGRHPDVAGLIVDIPRPEGYVTIVSLADDTTSLYSSAGGGVIGTGADPVVAAATHRLLAVVQAHLALFGPDAGGVLPDPGTVRFHLLSPAGRRSTDLPENAFLGNEPHPLTPVATAVNEVLARLRAVDEKWSPPSDGRTE